MTTAPGGDEGGRLAAAEADIESLARDVMAIRDDIDDLIGAARRAGIHFYPEEDGGKGGVSAAS